MQASDESAQADRAEARFALVVTLAYAVAVIVLALRHELFRDEVRPLGIVIASRSLGELFTNLRNEGHPALWYLLLYGAYRIAGSMLVLKPIAAAIAIAAAWIFCRHAALPRWTRALFLFGQLPLYEYSVMCRNYGISMLLVFALAASYHERWRRPLRMAIVLALLANTNAHSLILVAAFASAISLDMLRHREHSSPLRLALAAAIVLAAMAVSALVMAPDPTTIVTGVRALTAGDLARALGSALFAPTGFYQPLVGRAVELVLRALLVGLLVVLCDRPRLALALWLAAIAFAMFPLLIYATSERHIGLFLVFAIALLWMRAVDESPAWAPPAWLARARRHVVRAGPLVGALFLIAQIVLAGPDVIGDLTGQRSSIAALGELLRGTPGLADAIVIAEPDVFIEALPYYAPNRIYQPREGHFLLKVNLTTANARTLSLAKLMSAADEIAAREGRPIVLVIAHHLDAAGPFVLTYAYGKQFTYDPDSLARFRQRATLMAPLRASSGAENFDVYRWR